MRGQADVVDLRGCELFLISFFWVFAAARRGGGSLPFLHLVQKHTYRRWCGDDDICEITIGRVVPCSMMM